MYGARSRACHPIVLQGHPPSLRLSSDIHKYKYPVDPRSSAETFLSPKYFSPTKTEPNHIGTLSFLYQPTFSSTFKIPNRHRCRLPVSPPPFTVSPRHLNSSSPLLSFVRPSIDAPKIFPVPHCWVSSLTLIGCCSWR